MPPPTFIASEHYLDYTRQLRRLHRLIRRGDGDTEAADVIREAMDDAWPLLTPEETARARQMSADLNRVGAAPPTDAEADLDGVRRRLHDAERAGDWPGILALLGDHPTALPPRELAYARGRCWAALGEIATAAMLYAEAVRLDPLADRPALALIQALGDLGRYRRRDRVVLALAGRGNQAIPPRLVDLIRRETEARATCRAASRSLREARRELHRSQKAAREARRALRRSREQARRRPLFEFDSSSPLP